MENEKLENQIEMIDDGKIVIEVDGVKKQFDLLFSFDCEENERRYVGYTDNSKDSDGKLKINVSKFDPEVEPVKFEVLTMDEEWDMVNDVIDQIKGQF